MKMQQQRNQLNSKIGTSKMWAFQQEKRQNSVCKDKPQPRLGFIRSERSKIALTTPQSD
jgi:hypothetical protein